MNKQMIIYEKDKKQVAKFYDYKSELLKRLFGDVGGYIISANYGPFSINKELKFLLFARFQN